MITTFLRKLLHFPETTATRSWAFVTCPHSFRLKCKWIHDTVVWRKSIFGISGVYRKRKPPPLLLNQILIAAPKAGRHGSGPPNADDLAGSKRGWGVPVQPVRQAGELGGEWSNSAEVESQLKWDYGRLDKPAKKLALATPPQWSCYCLSGRENLPERVSVELAEGPVTNRPPPFVC